MTLLLQEYIKIEKPHAIMFSNSPDIVSNWVMSLTMTLVNLFRKKLDHDLDPILKIISSNSYLKLFYIFKYMYSKFNTEMCFLLFNEILNQWINHRPYTIQTSYWILKDFWAIFTKWSTFGLLCRCCKKSYNDPYMLLITSLKFVQQFQSSQKQVITTYTHTNTPCYVISSDDLQW